jgi:alpha-tubulin suppressor-like RCC1 family protein
VRSLSLGHTHSCAVTSEGALLCWGGNAYGELGDGTTRAAPVPRRASLLEHVAEAALGDQHTCALGEDGAVRCVGFNDLGQLGDGTTESRTTPVRVGVEGAVELAAGARFTCARLRGGSVSCWGANLSGQLGDGTTRRSGGPTTVGGVERAVQLVASAQAACARRDDGVVSCWGLAEIPGEQDRRAPAVVGGGMRFIDVALGDRMMCGKRADGEVLCWGTNLSQDGSGGLGPVPRAMPELRGATELASGGRHACARLPDGGIACFGENRDGQVGDGSRARRTPREVPLLRGVTIGSLAAGPSRTCAAAASGGPICWGDREHAEGSATALRVPRLVRGWQDSLGPVVRVAVDAGATCALSGGGSVACWADPGVKALGRDVNTSTEALVLAAKGAVDVAVGTDHACFIDSAGAVLCVGDATLGSLGPGARGLVSTPRRVTGLPGPATRIVASGSRTCAIVRDGKVSCWGGGSYAGGLTAVALAQAVPQEVRNVTGATALALSVDGGCAIARGVPLCWTQPNAYPSIVRALPAPTGGPLPPASAEPIPGVADAVDVATSGAHACAVVRDGGVYCWGRDDVGQLGDGGLATQAAPVRVLGLSFARAVVTGSRHTCVSLRDGGARCWGIAVDGALGDDTREVVERPARVVW